MNAISYPEFVKRKSQIGTNSGFDPVWMPDFLYDFQSHLLNWSVRKGQAALFADCGLGKTPMQLAWAENVARQTGRPVLVIAPLAVAHQTKREADKFGIDAQVSRDGTVHRITITNYRDRHAK